MQTWSDVSTSGLVFSYAGTTASTAHGTNDGVNIVTFGQLPEGTAAENKIWYSAYTGNLQDSDIRFNTYYAWSTTGSPWALDVQNVGTHELGHSLCLKDLYDAVDSEKTMYGNTSNGETKKRTLHTDDIDGITYLYTCPNSAVRIAGASPEYYASLQEAYDAAASGDTIQSHVATFTEDLYIDRDKTVTVEGGYDCTYSQITGETALNGILSITGGISSIENFVVE